MGRLAFSAALLALATAAAASSGAAAEEPLRLAPSSSWIVDYDADSCALRRGFDAGDQKVTLEIRQYAPGDELQVIIASNYLETGRRTPQVKFVPDDGSLERPEAIMGSFGGGTEGLFYRDSLRPNADKSPEQEAFPWSIEDRNARERAITGLEVGDAFTRDVLLETGAMHRPMEVMRSCLDELLTHWGIDIEAHKDLSRRVIPKDMRRWVRQVQQHYPADMLRERRGGYIGIRLMVATTGEPTSCTVQIEANDPSFQETACDTLMRYARFEPALDAQGEPIPSYFVTSILYRLAY